MNADTTAPKISAKCAVSILYLGADIAGSNTVAVAPIMPPRHSNTLVTAVCCQLGFRIQELLSGSTESIAVANMANDIHAVMIPKANAIGTRSQLIMFMCDLT